jgi:hypothetical protein
VAAPRWAIVATTVLSTESCARYSPAAARKADGEVRKSRETAMGRG